MVGITVILAAVIGTFVLGLGDQVESAPQASFDFQEGDAGELDITHRGGDTIDTNTVEVRLDGEDQEEAFEEDQFRAGDTVDIEGGDTGEDVDIVFTSGDRQDIIGSFTIPENFATE